MTYITQIETISARWNQRNKYTPSNVILSIDPSCWPEIITYLTSNCMEWIVYSQWRPFLC
jgi:hypothetical protein